MKQPVMLLCCAGERGKLKSSILCERLVNRGITHLYERVGDCHTVTVEESAVASALASEVQ